MTPAEIAARDRAFDLEMSALRRKLAAREAARERSIAEARRIWEAGQPARDAEEARGAKTRAHLRSIGAPDRVIELGYRETLQMTWDVCLAPIFHLWILVHASDESRMVAIGLGADFAEHVTKWATGDALKLCVDAIESTRAYALNPSGVNRHRCKLAGDASDLAKRRLARSVDMPVLHAASAAAYAPVYGANYVFGVSRHGTQSAYSNSPGGMQALAASNSEGFWQADRIREICPICPINEVPNDQ